LGGARDDRAQRAADLVALNAGAAIFVAGLAASMDSGVAEAQRVIADGSALQRLEQLAELSQSL
ncbi:MAG: anthranilate phosphoribosyltransferase, partial [Anaerolineae bacterium]